MSERIKSAGKKGYLFLLKRFSAFMGIFFTVTSFASCYGPTYGTANVYKTLVFQGSISDKTGPLKNIEIIGTDSYQNDTNFSDITGSYKISFNEGNVLPENVGLIFHDTNGLHTDVTTNVDTTGVSYGTSNTWSTNLNITMPQLSNSGNGRLK